MSTDVNIQSVVTNVDTVQNTATPINSNGVPFVENERPIDDNVDKTTKFTNGPHGAEYQLGSRIPHTQVTVSNGQDNNRFNFINPIKQSRKDTDPPISLITPLTHLTLSGSFIDSKNNITATSIETSQPTQFGDKQPTTPFYSGSLHGLDSSPQVNNPYRQNTIQEEREPNRPSSQQPFGFFTVTTPKNEPTRGIITHMNAISQTRLQSSRVTPSLTSVTANNGEQPNRLIFNQPVNSFTPEEQPNIRPAVTQTSRPELVQTVKSTEYPFLYTRSRPTSSNIDNVPYQGESSPGSSTPDFRTKTPNDELTIYSEFGQKIKPGTNPATTSFTAYYPGSTSRPVTENDAIPSTDRRDKPTPSEHTPSQPKFVLRPTGQPAVNSNRQPLSNFNGYYDAELRNANFYPDANQQKIFEFNDKNRNNIQPESKYVNTKKEFVPQYNAGSTPIPGLFSCWLS